MVKILSYSLLLSLLISQISCKTLELEGDVDSPKKLELTIPADSFDLRFADGYQHIKQQHYYYESSSWMNKNRNIDFFASYTYLLGNYIFVREPTVKELINKYFEDRVQSIGEKKILTKKGGGLAKRDEVTSIVPFTLMGAECHFFQRFLYIGSQAYDYISDGSVSAEDQGDAKIYGYFCNYSQSTVSNDDLEKFILEINAGSVALTHHINELKNKDATPKANNNDDVNT